MPTLAKRPLNWSGSKIWYQSPPNERLACAEPDARALTLTAQCELLGLNRISWYYQPKPPSPQDFAIKHRIDELFTAYPFYDSRKIAQASRPQFILNGNAVQRHLRGMGLVAITPALHLSKP